MTYNIESDLDRLLEEADARAARAVTRAKIARGVFEARRERVDLSKASPLRRRRLTFREDGLSVPALAERSTVSESTIRSLETGETSGSDLTWQRLARALADDGEPVRRSLERINPTAHVR